MENQVNTGYCWGYHTLNKKSGYYMVQLGVVTLLTRLVTTMKKATMYSYYKWYAKKGSHKLTACFKMYCTY